MSHNPGAAGALTDRASWDLMWSRRRDVHFPDRSWYPDDRFIRLFDSLPVHNDRPVVLELGAAASRWLPFLAVRWQAEVWGLDYSTRGCELARDALARTGVHGTILQRDLFDPNDDLVGRFDLVYSLGLIEHFSDTAAAVRAMTRFTRTGGFVLSVVPNMCGLIGLVQRLADRDVYAGHARLTPEALHRAHRSTDLVPIRWGWFGSYDPTVVSEGRSGRITERVLSAWRFATRTPIWATLRLLRAEPESRLFSPHVVCVAQREDHRA